MWKIGLRMIDSLKMVRVSGTMGIGDDRHCRQWSSRMMVIAANGVADDKAANNRIKDVESTKNEDT